MRHGEAGELVPLRGGLRPQLGGAQGAEVDIDQVQAAGAGGEHVSRAPFDVGQDRAGQPPRRPGAYVAWSARGGGPQVQDARRPGGRGPGRADRTAAGPRARCVASTASRAPASRVAARSRPADVSPVSNRLPSSTSSARAAHQARCWRRNIRRASALRDTAVARSPEADAASAAANSSSARRAADPCSRMLRATASSATRRASRCSSRGEQDLHAGHVQLRLEDVELVDHLLGVVEEGEGGGQVAAGERGGAAVVQRRGVLEALAGPGEQLLGPGVVLVGAGDRAQREVGLRAVAERPPLPDQVVGGAEQVDGPLRRPEHVGVPAQQPQRMRQPDLDATRCRADGPVGRLLDLGQTPWVSGQHQRHAVRRTHVGLPLRVAGTAGAPDRGPELRERLVDVPEVAQHDGRGLVGDRGDVGPHPVGEQAAGRRQRLVRTGQGEGQQPVHVRDGCGALRGHGHGFDVREIAVAGRWHERERETCQHRSRN